MTENEIELRRAIQRLNERAWGIAVGMLLGTGLFIATNVLVVKGGVNVGLHLSLSEETCRGKILADCKGAAIAL